IDQYAFEIKSQFENITTSRLIYEVVRKLISDLIADLLLQTNNNLQKQKIITTDDIRHLDYQLVNFTDKAKERIMEIKQFLYDKVYRYNKLTSITLKCQKIVQELFRVYMDNVDLLPFSWKELIIPGDIKSKADIVADYIAGMTDRFAIQEYQALYSFNSNNI
ncbi:MAG: deoxyguanosinetriphosphate triphosphohydrolase, partial [Candidatus Tisiphia sp.]